MPSLDDRLRHLEDRAAIQDLVAEYCRAIDDRDLDAFLDTYTDDCVLRHRDDSMRIDGKPALRAYYADRFLQYGVTFHYPHAHVIEFAGPDDAHGWVTGHAEMALQGQAWLTAIRYADRYRRVDGRWRFAERVLSTWYYMPLADLPSGMAADLRKHYGGKLLPADLPETLDTYRALHGL